MFFPLLLPTSLLFIFFFVLYAVPLHCIKFHIWSTKQNDKISDLWRSTFTFPPPHKIETSKSAQQQQQTRQSTCTSYHHILTHFEVHAGNFELQKLMQVQDVNNLRDSFKDFKLESEFLTGRNMALSSTRKRYIRQVFTLHHRLQKNELKIPSNSEPLNSS